MPNVILFLKIRLQSACLFGIACQYSQNFWGKYWLFYRKIVKKLFEITGDLSPKNLAFSNTYCRKNICCIFQFYMSEIILGNSMTNMNRTLLEKWPSCDCFKVLVVSLRKKDIKPLPLGSSKAMAALTFIYLWLQIAMQQSSIDCVH